ncbi:hypothetical protein WN48_07396 [Eufriesea mexicana]|uniref:Uncharacterized protein n=1 Tax=Eufriesea mexicana TaxID=516756 RepID=A0A310STT0_9HYME|nr:hypothetical protein WN48_07396 [Eufriesea mexicana]
MVIQAIVSRALNSVTTEPKHAMTVVSQHSLASARGVYISPLFAESGEIVRRTSPKLSQSRNSQRFYFLLPLKTPGNIDCVEDEAQRRSTRRISALIGWPSCRSDDDKSVTMNCEAALDAGQVVTI